MKESNVSEHQVDENDSKNGLNQYLIILVGNKYWNFIPDEQSEAK